jgi:hypothetical protein
MVALASSTLQRDPIHLSHPTIEHSLVIKKVLDIVYTSDFNVKLIEADFNLVKFMIDFGKKWEIPMIRIVMRRELSRTNKRIRKCFIEYFLVALHLEDNELAVKYYAASAADDGWDEEIVSQIPDGKRAFQEQIYRTESKGQESSPRGHHYLNDVGATSLPANHALVICPGGDIFDVNVMPYEWYLQFPPTVLWMINRARVMYNQTSTRPEQSLHTLLDLACKYLLLCV